MPRITPPAISARKGGEPIVCLTAYTTQIARMVDAHCDLLLVGDSLGMVVYGLRRADFGSGRYPGHVHGLPPEIR